MSPTVAIASAITSIPAQQELSVEVLTGVEARKYWQQIASLRIDMFKEFPYLYEGSFEYEKAYLETYFQSKNSVILLVFAGDEVVGFSNSIPLSEEWAEIKEPFLKNNIDLASYLYIGEVMIQPQYRGKGLLRKFFEYHESFAKEHNFREAVFMTVKRAIDHPQRPKEYTSPDAIWEHFGYQRLAGMSITLPWKQIDSHQEEMNQLELWQKSIS